MKQITLKQVKYRKTESLGRVTFVFKTHNKDVLCPPPGTYTAEPDTTYNVEAEKVLGLGFHLTKAEEKFFLLGLTLYNQDN